MFYCGKIGHMDGNCYKKKLDETWHIQKKHAGHFADEDQNHNLKLFVFDFSFSIENDEA